MNCLQVLEILIPAFHVELLSKVLSPPPPHRPPPLHLSFYLGPAFARLLQSSRRKILSPTQGKLTLPKILFFFRFLIPATALLRTCQVLKTYRVLVTDCSVLYKAVKSLTINPAVNPQGSREGMHTFTQTNNGKGSEEERENICLLAAILAAITNMTEASWHMGKPFVYQADNSICHLVSQINHTTKLNLTECILPLPHRFFFSFPIYCCAYNTLIAQCDTWQPGALVSLLLYQHKRQ